MRKLNVWFQFLISGNEFSESIDRFIQILGRECFKYCKKYGIKPNFVSPAYDEMLKIYSEIDESDQKRLWTSLDNRGVPSMPLYDLFDFVDLIEFRGISDMIINNLFAVSKGELYEKFQEDLRCQVMDDTEIISDCFDAFMLDLQMNKDNTTNV